MKKEFAILRSIKREVSATGYFRRAQQRAARRKSPWNLILIPLFLGGAGLISYALFQIMWYIHVIIYPAHIGKLGEFWGKGIGASSFISSFLLVMPLLFASIPISMLLTNAILWLVAPARRAFDREARGIKWASFRESIAGLWAITLIIVPILLSLSLLGAATLKNLR